jgi:hypothetical protein
MGADFYMARGADKIVSKDYAVAGKSGYGEFGIVSDGCSTSDAAEIGSMLLTISATADSSMFFVGKVNEMFCHTAFSTTHYIVTNLLGLHERSLNATLMLAHNDGEYCRIIVAGDGVLFWKKRDGELFIARIEFDKQRPYYLSYYFDPSKRAAYERLNITKKMETNGIKTEIIDGYAISNFSFETVDLEFFGVASDGFFSLFRQKNGKRAVLDKMQCLLEIRKCLDFQSFTGKFVQRELDFHVRRWQREEIKHADDISIAAVKT